MKYLLFFLLTFTSCRAQKNFINKKTSLDNVKDVIMTEKLEKYLINYLQQSSNNNQYGIACIYSDSYEAIKKGDYYVGMVFSQSLIINNPPSAYLTINYYNKQVPVLIYSIKEKYVHPRYFIHTIRTDFSPFLVDNWNYYYSDILSEYQIGNLHMNFNPKYWKINANDIIRLNSFDVSGYLYYPNDEYKDFYLSEIENLDYLRKKID